MKWTNLTLKDLILGIILVWATVLGSVPLAFAQGVDQEPNNTCQTAQNFGAVAFPFRVDGSLDTPPETPDVDFFKFTGTPGTPLSVDLEGQDTGKGTLGDPFLGLFDSNCNLIAFNDDSGTFNSRLALAIPANGIFVLAATSFPDSSFAGNGGSSGTYQLTLTPTPFIISGRIVDAVTGGPLRGDAFPFTFVALQRCGESGCFFVNNQPADSEGHFRFNVDFAGQPLEVGTYQISASADQYEQGQTDPFDVGQGENRNVGDVPLQPFPAQFSEILPCGDLPPEGGICRYSVRVTNRSSTALNGAAWSIVDAIGIGSLLDSTLFQTASPKKMTLPPGASKVVRFEFEVPSTVNTDATICARVFFGKHRLKPFFNTVGQMPLFCVFKEFTGFSAVPEKEAHKLLRQLDRRSLRPPRKK